jgi:polyphosphate kinase
MNKKCLQDAGIDLATEIASSQVGARIDLHDEDENDVHIFNLMEEDNIVLAHPLKFSSLLKLIRSAAWMYRFIKKTQKLTRNVRELTTKEMEWAKIRWYNYS